ncbi:hypothetical protein CRP01_02780 [Flavilitoribacter nigricans DSM 23189 = NBRC 102662]|uniref:Uncharacterized protein n=1 Tax=Flavilitoribacter nigricans (strain ATCC 23147 / DSM 23189 / NBRC 102662 / NCIMB 1420 / SS-2) TaxID=1122177 RepID=A0A2D0NIE4_FLAN2|nr:hypothetical protein CRP01_02780 [Flavilitoribacter nigricans DSM 23189 = NBRC 102662]
MEQFSGNKCIFTVKQISGNPVKKPLPIKETVLFRRIIPHNISMLRDAVKKRLLNISDQKILPFCVHLQHA